MLPGTISQTLHARVNRKTPLILVGRVKCPFLVDIAAL